MKRRETADRKVCSWVYENSPSRSAIIIEIQLATTVVAVLHYPVLESRSSPSRAASIRAHSRYAAPRVGALRVRTRAGPGRREEAPPRDGPETNPRDADFNSNPASFLSAAKRSDRARAPRRAGGLTAGELSVPLGDPLPTRIFATIASASPSGARNAARSTPFEALVVHRLNPTATRPAYLR